jgi:hypothetical protein
VHESNLFVLYEQAQNPNTLSLRDPPNFGLNVVFCDPVVVPAHDPAEALPERTAGQSRTNQTSGLMDFSKRRVFWKRHEVCSFNFQLNATDEIFKKVFGSSPSRHQTPATFHRRRCGAGGGLKATCHTQFYAGARAGSTARTDATRACRPQDGRRGGGR